MIRYHQTKYGKGYGNCFPTCLACLLEIKPDRVPRYNKDYSDWLQKYNEWLEKFGISYMEWDYPWGDDDLYIRKDHYVILAGDSPRSDCGHAVVGEIETLDKVGFLLRRFKSFE